MNLITHRRRVRLQQTFGAQTAAALPAPERKLEVTSIDAFPLREPVSGATYTVLRIATRAGLVGYGECSQASSEDLAAARRFWIGRPATTYATSPEGAPLSGGVDMALLDIIGKSCNASVHRVLGGPTRNKVRVFASLEAKDTEASLKTTAESGFRAFGLNAPPPHARNQGQAYQLSTRKIVELVRAAGGDFILEAAGQLSPGDAASVAITIQPFHPLWFDEPCLISNLQTLHKISDESVVPLGFGREITTAGAFQDMLRLGLIDIVRPDLHHFGITQSRRIAALAETYYVAVAPRHDGGPIATAAALQLAAILPNFFIQHIPFPASPEDRSFREQLTGTKTETVQDGFAQLSTAPGLGITVNQSFLEKNTHAA